ncbi:hypothetical protein IEQ34_008993 [Dendrobium chrysotoxum]|uniref:Uncharacterized protein n=1 Tax=Dendrobium chrysotoxum TaxID=161865 RepID=A0AAV7H0K2_DENCH|nr:hypothetical protein IEQ34_008993 [Dendrobium chrysotoxum]
MELGNMPEWSKKVARDNNVGELKFLICKKVDASDLSLFLRLPNNIVEEHIIHFNLTEKIIIWHTQGGLNVSVYVQGGWKIELFLTLSDDRKDIGLQGNEMTIFQQFSQLKDGDNVAIWMFRRPDDKLCFFIWKAVDFTKFKCSKF